MNEQVKLSDEPKGIEVKIYWYIIQVLIIFVPVIYILMGYDSYPAEVLFIDGETISKALFLIFILLAEVGTLILMFLYGVKFKKTTKLRKNDSQRIALYTFVTNTFLLIVYSALLLKVFGVISKGFFYGSIVLFFIVAITAMVVPFIKQIKSSE